MPTPFYRRSKKNMAIIFREFVRQTIRCPAPGRALCESCRTLIASNFVA